MLCLSRTTTLALSSIAVVLQQKAIDGSKVRDRRNSDGSLKSIRYIAVVNEIKYHLHTKEDGSFGKLPLTTAQQVRVNGALSNKVEASDIESFLSPDQIKLWKRIKESDVELPFCPDSNSKLAAHFDVINSLLK
ncbi:UNVERIFIED_CONTAM: hypothetical protein HDU68_006435 [Siphonaria sp. JEL0065]|nr:hypothetical protein HDU68_006435 [Siphonaria sp. JEL0065]